eukprot:CAMPEP_0204562162 /NCGR_PEP_ID=MMETSP0661-20131031/33596_1 /ASSEMBLY_ACC=CAM_ASM_000606 /TAXON_ID=109239 /ORGANISM="Alexandrium margalefi, Strain AMGDE01CS-322" /LENGTH=137 /DNA_ID=CAMNT_0051569631 /DNA_START=83 /DNA_END=496 /DNA_ORIENTATION=+
MAGAHRAREAGRPGSDLGAATGPGSSGIWGRPRRVLGAAPPAGRAGAGVVGRHHLEHHLEDQRVVRHAAREALAHAPSRLPARPVAPEHLLALAQGATEYGLQPMLLPALSSPTGANGRGRHAALGTAVRNKRQEQQ